MPFDGLPHPRWLFGTALRTLLNHGMPHFESMGATCGPTVLSRDLVRAVGLRDQLAGSISRCRRRWKGRLVLKGVLSARAAALARDNGADGIIVSNHGGRQTRRCGCAARRAARDRAGGLRLAIMMVSAAVPTC